jgi:hypothetical protein
MHRRTLITAIAALFGKISLPEIAYAASPTSDSVQLEIGPWAFSLPAGWVLNRKHEPDVPYFESSDGSKGCYVKSLRFNQPPPRTPMEIAAYIQRIHKQSFEKDTKAKWRVIRDEIESKNSVVYASLDLFDRPRKYHVLSKVLVLGEQAVQLTLHDYNCEDYDASVLYFSVISASLHAR